MDQIAVRWEIFSDLPDDWSQLASRELVALADVWDDQKQALTQSESLRLFTDRLLRQWAIDTGIIERLYSLDRGITETLIEYGIDAALIPNNATNRDPAVVARIIQDQHETVQGLFDFVKGNRALSVSYIKELHAQLTRHQDSTTVVDQFGRQYEKPLMRGTFKLLPNNPTRPDGRTHEYCPPEHVDSEMDRLIETHLRHEAAQVSPEVEAAWLHHRFTQIHPFEDGNGRVARALASLVFIRAGWFPLAVSSEEKERVQYIDALEAADSGDLGPLVRVFSTIQKRTFVKALSIAGDVVEQEQVDQVIGAVRGLFESRQKALEKEWAQAKTIANALLTRANQRLESTASKLQQELGPYSRTFRFRVDTEPSGGHRGHWFRLQMIHAAKDLGFFANPNPYMAWSRLVLETEQHAEVLLMLQGIGHDYRGLIAGSMLFFRRDESGDGERDIGDLITVSEEYFQVNYRDSLEESESRFESWLRQGLVRGLEVWRRGL